MAAPSRFVLTAIPTVDRADSCSSRDGRAAVKASCSWTTLDLEQCNAAHEINGPRPSTGEFKVLLALGIEPC